MTDPLIARVSVVLPTHNRCAALMRAVESVLGQTHPVAELIIVDDGSTDGTTEVVRRLMARSENTRVRLIAQPQRGPSSARNRGIEVAVGDFIAFIDSDDVWALRKLELQMPAFSVGVGMVFTGYTESGRESVLAGFPEHLDSQIEVLLEGCIAVTSTAVVRRDAIADVGLFDESLRTCEDWDLWLRLAVGGWSIGYIPMPLLNRGVFGDNLSSEWRAVNRDSLSMLRKLLRAGASGPFLRDSAAYMARFHLNNAVRALQNGDGLAARSSLLRAAVSYPRAVRPGWLWMLMRSAV